MLPGTGPWNHGLGGSDRDFLDHGDPRGSQSCGGGHVAPFLLPVLAQGCPWPTVSLPVPPHQRPCFQAPPWATGPCALEPGGPAARGGAGCRSLVPSAQGEGVCGKPRAPRTGQGSQGCPCPRLLRRGPAAVKCVCTSSTGHDTRHVPALAPITSLCGVQMRPQQRSQGSRPPALIPPALGLPEHT